MPRPTDPTPAVLLTGLPSVGKTTIGGSIVAELQRRTLPVHLLDGDELRRRLPPDLGFSRADREAQAERAGYIATVLQQHGVVPVLALVLPYAASRRRLMGRLGPRCVEVHLTAPLPRLVERDTRSVYRRAAASGDAHYAAILEPYEVPEEPTLRLDTDTLSLEACVTAIVEILERDSRAAPRPAEGTRATGRRDP